MSDELTLDELGIPGQTTSELSVEHAVRIGATIDSAERPREGDALPLLWHWAYFTPSTPTSELGPDGHPRLPPGPISRYPRRMWASGRVVAEGSLVLGAPATRHSRLVSSKESDGRSGALLIVQVEHRYSQQGVDRIVETQTLVYRQEGPVLPLPAGDHRPEIEPGQWQEAHTLTPPALFRFSAVTFNSHRIHYDQPYATSVEGYPTLVVHGPLTALLVAESVRRRFGRDLARFEFRASAPLFAGTAFTIVGTPGTPGTPLSPVSAVVVRNDGVEAMQVTADLTA